MERMRMERCKVSFSTAPFCAKTKLGVSCEVKVLVGKV